MAEELMQREMNGGHLVAPGLIAHDFGVRGVIYQTADALQVAEGRHETVFEFLDRDDDAPVGAKLLLALVCNEAILTRSCLSTATSISGALHGHASERFLAWTNADGWRDRRQLTPQTVDLIERNGGCFVRREDRRWLRKWLGARYPGTPRRDVLECFIADAAAWWYGRLPPPLFTHAVRLRRFQALTTETLARIRTGRPQKTCPTDERSAAPVEEIPWSLMANWTRSSNLSSIDGVIAASQQILAIGEKRSTAVQRLVEVIGLSMSTAMEEGRVQAILLGALRHVLLHGGVQGTPWALSTVRGYVGAALRRLAEVLVDKGMPVDSGRLLLERYREVVLDAAPSQRPKACAFLEAIHQYLVIAGYEPLPESISGAGFSRPHAAAAISREDIERAVAYVDAHAPTSHIALQATLCLRAAHEIPLRSYEPWCFRVGDVSLNRKVVLAVMPRPHDGVGKSPQARREEVVTDSGAVEAFVRLDDLRRNVHFATDDHLLLGQPGQRSHRYEQEATMRLMQSALRWATGDPWASFYDLRHQAFSARAIEVWNADATRSDAQLWIHMSKRSGHAGPTSTEAYIHQIEGALADAAKRERPSAWSGLVPAMDSGVFVLLESLVVDKEPSVPGPLTSIAVGAPASEMDFRKRLDVVWHVANGLKLKAVAGAKMLSEEAVKAAVRDQAQAIEMAGRSGRPVNATVHAQCAAVSSQFLLARASLQPKCAPVVHHFDQLMIVG
jgi:hypothetical protein